MKDFSFVLFVGPTDRNGGMGAVVRTYSKMSDIFYFISTHDSSITNKVIFYLKSLLSIIRFLILHEDIRIVHIHTASKGSFYRKSLIVLIARLLLRKVILHIHGGGFISFVYRYKNLKKYVKFILNRSDIVICLSAECKEKLLQLPVKCKISILENPVVDHHYPRFHSFNGILNLLYLGNISPSKGIFDLLDYFKDCTYFNSGKIKLTIGGLGDLDRLMTYLNDPFYHGNINYLGWLDASNKPDQFSKHDVLILPSYHEGLPVCILEALTAKLPVISTTVGGIPDILKNGTNGWLFQPGEFKQLDLIFDEIFENPQLLELYGKSSDKILAPFLSANVRTKLLELYTSILN